MDPKFWQHVANHGELVQAPQALEILLEVTLVDYRVTSVPITDLEPLLSLIPIIRSYLQPPLPKVNLPLTYLYYGQLKINLLHDFENRKLAWGPLLRLYRRMSISQRASFTRVYTILNTNPLDTLRLLYLYLVNRTRQPELVAWLQSREVYQALQWTDGHLFPYSWANELGPSID